MKEEGVVIPFLAGAHGHHPTNDECIYSKYGSTAVWKLYFRRIGTCQVSDCPLQQSGHTTLPYTPLPPFEQLEQDHQAHFQVL
jgi:hypothetical protein